LLGYEVHHGTARPVCVGTRGPLTVRGAELVFAKYARQAGMPDITLATLRHTFCRNLVEAGADVASLAALAGHTTLESALPYFAPQRQNLEQLVEVLADEA
jgi:integrase/recombinase XerC